MIRAMDGNGTFRRIAPEVRAVAVRRRGKLPVLLIVASLLCGAAQAQNAPANGKDEVTFRPWIGTLGVHFQSERPFDAAERTPSPAGYRLGRELSGRAGAAGLQGLGLGGVWRPFQNGFEFNFAMYLDPVESDETKGFRSRTLSDLGFPAAEPVSFTRSLDTVSYVGLGWKTNGPGLGVNLDVGAVLSDEDPLHGDACLGLDPTKSECGAASLGNGRSKLPGSFRGFEWYPVVSLGIEYRF